MDNVVNVIILAAGNSSRMNGINKILQKLSNGLEVIINTIYKFDNIQGVLNIIVVVKNNIVDDVNKIIKNYKFRSLVYVIAGGETRTKSLLNGYGFMRSKFKVEDCSYCIIHDGARPLINQRDVLNCLKDAFVYGASAVGVKMIDTVKLVDKNHNVVKTVNRENLFCIQTPQIFKVDILNRAIENAKNKNLDFTDDCQLVEAIGEKVHISDTSKINVKITTQEDLFLVNKLLDV